MIIVRRHALAAIALVLLVALASCDDDGGRPDSVATSPSPTAFASATGACSNVAEVLEAPPLGGELNGDVTGDGSEDSVHLARDEAAETGCREFLVVEVEGGAHVVPLTEEGREYALAEPRLNSLATIDAEPGAEVLVDLEQGASTQFVGMFTLHEGDLVRVRFQGEGAPPDLFPYGGSVGHIEASDCGEEPGTVVVSVATPLRDRYEVERSVYRFDGAELIPDRGASERVVVAPEEVQELPEFRASPFGSCSPA